MWPPLLIALVLALTCCSKLPADQRPDPAVSAKAREARAHIRRLERRLIGNRDPHGFDYRTFVRALRDLGREVEADALVDYTERAFRGEFVNESLTTLESRECQDMGIVRRWGKARSQPDEYTSRVGRVAARFWIGTDTGIEKIRVVRAMDPGAAWIVINSIGEAKISKSRTRRMAEDDSVEFPLELCTTWNHEERRDRLPAGGNIRGF